MHREHPAGLLQREVHLSTAVFRKHRAWRDVVQEYRGVFDMPCEHLGPLGAGVDAFVVPEVEAGLGQMGDLGIDERSVIMRITHKDIRFIAFVGAKGAFQRTSPNTSTSVYA